MAVSERSQIGAQTFDRGTALDDLDWRILGELQENARITFSELGRRVSLTPPAVAERVRRME
ncbi:MAG TPA: AsnC family transcriptional regulator, partial [Actinomycetota bacterium]|nr:AsnC family transcriptional regulator [Actinomycetota bacterium]